ncbi:DUF6744 family protein [Streptosporangium longisporum]|uniref:Uncharacterized protein n=1 Tax=Streptosporangium longisporum TaxID=46187 RepID=A0ABP6L233_9ACTN
MTTPTPTPAAPAPAATGSTAGAFDAYTSAMEKGDTPLLGYLALYSIFEAPILRTDLERWFRELGLDEKFLPGPIREDDAFARVTGPNGVRATYKLTTSPSGKAAQGEKTIAVTLMIRHVGRTGGKITRHVVREVRDEGSSTLSYDTRMAELAWWRDPTESGQPGVGVLQIHPDESAINALSPSEQVKVRSMLRSIEESYKNQCAYFSSDRLRAIVRNYIESLAAVPVRSTGGVYFVHRTHAAPLEPLRKLVSRFGAGSLLTRVPLPEQEEMKDMVIAALTTKAKEDLQRLAGDIATARREGHSEAKVGALYRRFRALQKATAEHSELLSSSLDDTAAALELAGAQISSLLNG